MVFVASAEPVSLNETDSLGRVPTELMENFRAARHNQYVNEATLSLEYQFMDAYQESLNEIEAITGKKFRTPPVASFFDIAGDIEKNPLREKNFIRRKTVDDFFKQDEEIKKLKQQFPDIKSAEDVWLGVKKNAEETERETAEIADASTFLGKVGYFAGAMAGSFSLRDPVNLGTLGLGGAGRTILTRVLTEAGIGSGVEAVNELFGVRKNKELLGLENSIGRSLMNIAAAGAGAGVIRGGIEAAPIAAKNLASLTNEQVVERFNSLIKKQTTTERAAIAAIERDSEFLESANPFVKTIESEAAHITKIGEADAALRSEDPFDFSMLEKSSPVVAKKTEKEIAGAVKEIDGYLEEAKRIKEIIKNDIDINKPQTLKEDLGYVPESLTDFIRRTGGIQDLGGDLASMGVTNANTKKAFKRSLIRTEKETVATAQGKIQVENQIDAVKQRVFDAGYFPDKVDYNDISNDELFSAIEVDSFTNRIYRANDLERILEIKAKQNAIEEYSKIDITGDMTPEEIALKLRDADLLESINEIIDIEGSSLRGAYEQEIAARGASKSEYLSEIDAASIEAQLQDIKNNAGLFKSADQFDPNEQIPIGVSVGDDGEAVIVTLSLGDILKEIEEDDLLVEAARGCAL